MLFICLPDTPETEGLIGEREISLLPPGAVIVNVGRGHVLNEEAFFKALQNKHLLGAGVDCWYKYPADVKSRYNTPVSAKFDFGGLDNIVMSPHRAGSVGLPATERFRMAALAELFNAAAEKGFASMPN
ncbi:serA, partial [Symbiodinium pilosum]